MTPATRKPTSKLNVKARMLQAGWGEVSNGPRWLLPATPAAYDAMVERMARAMFEMRPGWSLKNMPPAFVEAWGNQARAALAAIGIKEPKA